jgi:hypothetical protein
MKQDEPLGPSCPIKDSRESSIVTSQTRKRGIDYSQKGLLLTKERREWLEQRRKLAIEQQDRVTATDRVTNDALMRRLHAYYTSIFAASRFPLTIPLCYCLGVQNANIIRRMDWWLLL